MGRQVGSGLWTAGVSSLVLLWLISACSAQYDHTIYVDPERGHNSTACLNSSLSRGHPCRNLSYAFQYRNSSTRYLLQPGTHYLDTTVSDNPFTNLHDIAITGNSSVADVICFTDNAGIAFISVTNITVNNVSFLNCASLQNSTSSQIDNSSHSVPLLKTQVALYFSDCESVTMQYVSVENSSNATGVIMYNTIGTNTFTDCRFSNNQNTYPQILGGGGGGFYIEFSYCLLGNTECENGSAESYTSHNQNSTYKFEFCIFNNNLATNREPKGQSSFIIPHRQNHEAFGRGGGLSVFFKANATGNKVIVNESVFTNNSALWGGGLFVEFHDTATGNSVSVHNSSFGGNSVLPGSETAGGGMRIGHFVFGDGVSVEGNNITLTGCNFTWNTAESGGGISFIPAGQRLTTSNGQLANLTLSNCIFNENAARLGLALQIVRFGLITGPVPHVRIVNIVVAKSFLYNVDDTQAYEVGGGALYMGGVSVDFVDHANFFQNGGSALLIIQAEASFQNCSANFYDNKSIKGGAILMLGSSTLLVNESTQMYFLNNTAKWEGGAIYKQYDGRDNMPQDPHCFVRHANPFLPPDNWNSSFRFINNCDYQGEIAIHTTSLKPCVWAGGMTIGNVTVNDVFCWKNWFYNKNHTQDEHCRTHLSSSPGNVTYNYSIEGFPGIEVQLPIRVLDDLNRKRKIGFHAFSQNTDTAEINEAFEYIADNTISFTGIAGDSFTLELDSTTQRLWHLEMSVYIRECPPGFVPTGNTNKSTCVCSEDSTVSYYGNVLCDYDNYNYSASLSGGHWMGKDSDNVTLVGNCPPQYCFKSDHHKYNPLPQSFSELDAHVCSHRTGVLCGRCRDDYGPAINSRSKSFNCVHCKKVNTAARTIYYFLLVYVPLFLLFLGIIVFNIKLTTGPANAFILYSQVISSTFDLSADGQIPLELSVPHFDTLLLVYQLPYSVFNLRFFEQLVEPFCLSPSFNTLDVLAFDNAVGFFPLAMIALIVVCVKVHGCCRGRCRSVPTWCERLRRLFPRIGDSIIPAFASFILLSYTKFTLTSSYLIRQESLINASGHSVESRVYYAGQYSSWEPAYILKYMIPASILFVLLGVLPPLLLLEYPLKWCELAIGRVACLKRHYPTTKAHIFLDAFQGSFRHRMRFFAGLYLLFRLIVDLSYTFSQSWVEHYLVQEVTCIVFIILLALCRPYKPEYNVFNFVDLAMFANLAVITALGLYLYTVSHINPHLNPPLAVFVVQFILVLLPLVCMIAALIWFLAVPRLLNFYQKLRSSDEGNNNRSSSVFNSRNFAASVIASSLSHPGPRQQRRFSISESGIDWDRATLKNTYCRSPVSSPHAPTELDGDEEEKPHQSRSTDNTTNGSHESSSDNVRTPLIPTSTYVAATYGTSGDTTSSSDLQWPHLPGDSREPNIN